MKENASTIDTRVDTSVSSLNRRLSVAPMMGCTDRHCRYLLRLLSPHAVLYSEMVVTGALLHGDENRFLMHGDDAPCAFQLGGSDPSALARAAKLVEQAGYQEVNLNCGCPSDRVQEGGIGACLMAEPERVADCFQAMTEAVSIPVTIKSRIGLDAGRDNSGGKTANTDELADYDFFSRFIGVLYAAGCRTFIVHARKAILQGLSPKENREIPPLKYEYVFRVMDEFPDAEFILNGGIKSLEQVSVLGSNPDSAPRPVVLRSTASDRKPCPGVHGLMLGRAPYANPWLLAQVEQLLFNTPMPDRMVVLSTYREYIAAQMALGEDFKHMAKHLLGFFTGCRGARHFRRCLSNSMFKGQADISVLDDALTQSHVMIGDVSC